MLPSTTLVPATHLMYLVISIAATIWVARTLRIRGRVFLATGCKGDEELTDSLSHLFSVGFYLVHVGFVLLALKLGEYAYDTIGAIELLSTKVGLVLLLLGISHLLHVAIYARIHGKPRGPAKNYRDPVTTAEVVSY